MGVSAMNLVGELADLVSILYAKNSTRIKALEEKLEALALPVAYRPRIRVQARSRRFDGDLLPAASTNEVPPASSRPNRDRALELLEYSSK